MDAANQSFGMVCTDSQTPHYKSSLLGNQWLRSGSHIFIGKSSNSTKINGHKKCWCCMTMPRPIPATKQHKWLAEQCLQVTASIPKTGLLHPSGNCQKDCNGALSSVGSVLKCDCVAVIISQPVFQASPNHFRMTSVHSNLTRVICTSMDLDYFYKILEVLYTEQVT
jgi:hypothetical protein